MTELTIFLVSLVVLLTSDVFVWRFVYHRARRASSTEAGWWQEAERSMDRAEANLAVAILNMSAAACVLVFVILR